MRSPAFCSVIALLAANASLIPYCTAERYDDTQVRLSDTYDSPEHRIAIIGAGAGGSSAAYHIARFYNESGISTPIQIDIFESNSYVGGRSTTVDALGDPRYPTELGASIFVKVNQVLYNLTKEFHLSTKDTIYETTGSQYDLGIWDGSSFVFTIDNDDGDSWFGRFKDYWDIAKLLWKYGMSPIRTKNAKDAVISKFLRMYDEYFPIASLSKFATEVGLADYTGITGQAALLKHDVSEEFAHDIIQSSTRVNYAQNLDGIHGLETMVCMAIEGAMSIDKGNWHIFDEAVKHSGAKLHLNTTVAEIKRTSGDTYQIYTENDAITKEYDTVILASPYQFSNITFIPALGPETVPPQIDYVTLHVTLFTSPYRPSPAFFGLTSQDEVPDSILTTLPPNNNSSSSRGTFPMPPRGLDAVGPSAFWSLSTLRVLNPQTDPFPPSLSDSELVRTSRLYPNYTTPQAGKQYLYKIFSPAPLTAQFVSDLFALNYTSPHTHSQRANYISPIDSNSDNDNDGEGTEEEPITALPSSLIPWTHTKVWHSYPYLPPTRSFAALMLDSPEEGYARVFNEQTKASPNALDARAVFYTSGVESFISTMETSALMGRNVARIVVDGLSMLSRVVDGWG